jgi:hypothetical protein
MRIIAMFVAIFALAGAAFSQSPANANPSEGHHDMVPTRNREMGFSAEKTTHHFRLFQDGGTIDVEVNDVKDTETRGKIRLHLSRIASMFSEGNFHAPMLIHDTTPPGVAAMTKLRADIRYEYQETATGARIRIRTRNAQALDAIHAFLLFQIIEHRTGDSAIVQ